MKAESQVNTVQDATAMQTNSSKTKKPVVFWGICDVKYDPRLPTSDRVQLLELGDGRTSRFSYHGRPIKLKFDDEYCMGKPINRAVMTENKKFTHDMFVQEGFRHLRPHTLCFPKFYHKQLADSIMKSISVPEGGAVVLKLCNRSRGAGVVVCPILQLDGTLKQLLSPPQGHDLERWLQEQKAKPVQRTYSNFIDEQCLHWWSNECPLFIVEECCHSIPVPKEEGSDKVFDGTMRVAFALRKAEQHKYHDLMYIKPFEIDWLGGYWKLPQLAVAEDCMNFEEYHSSIVSSFNSVEKRTAEVAEHHLQEVYDALTPALPRVFHTGALSVTMIMGVYKADVLFQAFALSRVAATMRATDVNKAKGLFDLARRMVPLPVKDSEDELPHLSVLSYIDRNKAVCAALQQEWEGAISGFQSSLQNMRTNATAYYCLGYCYERGKKFPECVDSMLAAISLDPDFKSPYILLGNCYLQLHEFSHAKEASLACLQRHPDAPGAHFNLGQAIYHLIYDGLVPHDTFDEVNSMAMTSLNHAKRRTPEQWSQVDEHMLHFVETRQRERAGLPKQPIHTWTVYGWRP